MEEKEQESVIHHEAPRNMTCIKMSVLKHRNNLSRIFFLFIFFLVKG